ncbi:hypothetical protein M9435_002997 [Picochlorum sp. BPE23]|nr:hypothetical protein M9435_002997 [Picochlorum sp. BPE23]
MLPIREFEDDIARTVLSNRTTIVVGETGSGKTTQLAQIILKHGISDSIVVTQPRRVAAVQVAKRVAQELNCDVGTLVGYRVRFEDRTSNATKICYMTDGVLLRELYEDPFLSKYSCIILDEAHERSLNSDILFGMLKSLMSHTRNLRLLVTSATLETEKFSNYFGGCPVINVPGRSFPVKIVHSEEDHFDDFEQAVVDSVLQIHQKPYDGDILVFLPGQAEIERVCKTLDTCISSMSSQECSPLIIIPLYAALPPEMQSRAFKSGNGIRRCIIATNIAETSVTVDGIAYVLDSGICKQKQYNPKTGVDSLVTVHISRVQAIQRAGRAGRTKAGTCYRLYTSATYENLRATTEPEIKRTSMMQAVLYLKSLPLTMNIFEFDFIDRPDAAAVEESLRQLYIIGAIDKAGNISDVGREMAHLPLDPLLSRSVIEAKTLGCLDEVVTVASMISQDSTLYAKNTGPQQRVQLLKSLGTDASKRIANGIEMLMSDELGDHIFYLRCFQAWLDSGKDSKWCTDFGINPRAIMQANDVRKQILSLVGNLAISEDTHSSAHRRPMEYRVRKALSKGYSCRLAKRLHRHNGFRTLATATSTLTQIHPCSARLPIDKDGLLPEWIIYHDLIQTSSVFLKTVTPVSSKWLPDVLDRIQTVDIHRLAGKSHNYVLEKDSQSTKSANKICTGISEQAFAAEQPCRRNDEASIAAAKARYLERKRKRNARNTDKK